MCFRFASLKKTITPLLVAVFLLLSTGGCRDNDDSFGNSGSSPLRGKYSDSSGLEVRQGFSSVYSLYQDRVVRISTERAFPARRTSDFFPRPHDSGPRTQAGLGSGFFISADGYICTNHHVVANVDSVTVHVGEDEYPAKVIGSDAILDLALIKIDGNKEFKPVFFGDSDKVRVGDWAIAIGNPFGLDRTFTVGVISSTLRKSIDWTGEAMIQTDASINPGNSGGPLINVDGEVIGINRMIYSKSGGSIGIGFAIAINEARSALQQIRKYKKVKRGYIGIGIADLNPEITRELNFSGDEGVVVTQTVPNGPAARAGLKPHDIILRAGDRKTRNTGELLSIVSVSPIGRKLRFLIWRRGQTFHLVIRIRERP